MFFFNRTNSLFIRQLLQTLLVFILFSSSFIIYVYSEKNIDAAEELRLRSFLLASELHQSSDDLTQMARSYVATGNISYKEHYQEILDIRNGDKPRPLDYRNIYWDLVRLDDKRPRLFENKAVALIDLMCQAGFTEEEFQKLVVAEKNSDTLTKTEFKAMKLIEINVSKTEKIKNREKAILMLNDEAYHNTKASIMSPIKEFYILMDKRTVLEVHEAKLTADILRILFVVMGVFLLYMLIRLYWIVRSILGCSADELHEQIVRIGAGDFSVPIAVNPKMKNSVLGWLSEMQSTLQKLMTNNERLKNLYAALSQCNQAIVRSKDESELFPIICHDAVHFGGMKMAWIGMHDEQSNQLCVVNFYGDGSEYLDEITISLDSNDVTSQGPTGTAFLEDRPYWCQDFQNDPKTTIWHDKGKTFGWKSSAALPLHRDGKVVGVFTLYSKDINAFDEDVKKLLEEMVLDISFALDTFESEKIKNTIKNSYEEQNNLLTSIIDNSPVRIFWKDRDLNYLGCNLVFAHDAGEKDSSSVIGKDDRQLCWKDQAELYRNDDIKVMESGIAKLFFEEPQTTPDGKVIWLSTSKVPLYNNNNEVIGIVGLYEEITTRKNAEIALKNEKEIAQNYLNIVGVMILVIDMQKNVKLINRRGCEILGYEVDEIIGKNWIENFVPQRMKSNINEIGDTLLKQNESTFSYYENPVLTKLGEERLILWNNIPLFDDKGDTVGVLASGEDITERRAYEERIHYLANFDELTGLSNRTQLKILSKNLLSIAKRHQDKMAVVFLDLDHFKDINDSLGHSIGDNLLIQASIRLKSILRDEDILARLGGDEFIVLLPNIDIKGSLSVAQKLLEIFQLPFQIDNHELSVSASIGIAIYPDDGDDFETLSKNADTAMYRAKKAGRNRFSFYTQEMQKDSIRHLELGNALRFALQRDQFELYYQPQLSAKNQVLVGAEALLRWKHPELGNVSPAEFIPIAEENGTILAIGEWVLRTAIKSAKEWLDQGMEPISIAVNLSAVQFRFTDLHILIEDMLCDIDLPPEYLEIELTESVAMQNPQRAIDVMNALHVKGIKMSIDDFGTGYSSLSYLKKFNVYKLKIDQSFVRDINVDEEDRAIVNTIISMAKSLGLKTIAEGVETIEQLNYLNEQGCDEIQGYYYSKPLPKDAFEEFRKNYIIV